ncbi:MAG: hypothetical protein MRY79_02995, partial [Alphaproteobacteria bacterium]|nr:hypothetical protein [Alphaproteobacteria bacterium]
MAANDNNNNNSERPKDKFAKAAVLSPRGVPSHQRVLRPGMDGYVPPDFQFKTEDGISVNGYKSMAKDEKAIILGCTGLKSNYVLEPDDLKYFNDHGISVVWISLPNPKR